MSLVFVFHHCVIDVIDVVMVTTLSHDSSLLTINKSHPAGVSLQRRVTHNVKIVDFVILKI